MRPYEELICREVDLNRYDIAVATSDGAKASQEAPQKSVFERSSLS